jgi:hypothetical protein
MKNITVSIPDHVYIQARAWAAYQSTSVSSAVRIILGELTTFPGPQMRARMTDRERTLALQKAAKAAGVPLGGRRVTNSANPANSANSAVARVSE